MRFTTRTLAALAALAAAAPQIAAAEPHKHHGSSAPTAAPHGNTYVVYVGAQVLEIGAALNAFFPPEIVVNVGDTITFKVNSFEPHAVTFTNSEPIPAFLVPIPGGGGGLMVNPLVSSVKPSANFEYNGKYFANSGLLGLGTPGLSWNVTFNETGSFGFVCPVHGATMGGKVTVVNKHKDATNKKYLRPGKLEKLAQDLIKLAQIEAHAVGRVIASASKKPVTNPKTNVTEHFVYMGGMAKLEKAKVYADFNGFYPDSLSVRKGDVVTWLPGPTNTDVPHTVTFLNGKTAPVLFKPVVQSSGAVWIEINAAAAAPSSNVNTPLTRAALFNSASRTSACCTRPRT